MFLRLTYGNFATLMMLYLLKHLPAFREHGNYQFPAATLWAYSEISGDIESGLVNNMEREDCAVWWAGVSTPVSVGRQSIGTLPLLMGYLKSFL